MIQSLLGSNMIQLLCTFALGALMYCFKNKLPLLIFSWFICSSIILSLLLRIGEVYVYHDYYGRAFFLYGDNISSIVVLICAYAALRGYKLLAWVAFTAVFVSGGKAALLLLLAVFFLLVLSNRKNARQIAIPFIKFLVMGFLTYFVVLGLSNLLDLKKISIPLNQFLIESSLLDKNKAISNHKGACVSFDVCFETQVGNAFNQRYYSSLAGLWMTMQGGYRHNYPNTPDKFADLMMKENPWGMNEKYQIGWADWERMGQVQNPYLSFGSGYGPWLLGGLVVLFTGIAWMSIANLKNGETTEGSVFSVFFLVTVILNQTQSWLHSGSWVLVLVGFCASHVVINWLLRNNYFPDFLKFAVKYSKSSYA